MIEFRMLGSVSLVGPDGHEVRSVLAQPRRLALLAYLAAAAPRGLQRRDTLLPLFWPEQDQAHARTALRQAIRVLRGALGTEAIVGRGDEEIGLDFTAIRCDVGEFDAAIEAGRLTDALGLYRGNLLEGFFISDAPEFERWHDRERARLGDAARRAAETLCGQAEARGDLGAATMWARRAVQLAPHDEGLVRRLVTVLDLQGDRAGALQVYDELARRLSDDFEAQPAAETQALIAAVRARVAPRALRAASVPANVEQAVTAPRRGRPRRLALGAGLVAVAAVTWLVAFPIRAHPGRSGSPRPAPTSNAEAYDLYARGKVVLGHVNRENDSVAITLYERAVALDPTFAVAQAELSGALLLHVIQFARGDSVAFQRAQVAADRALRLQPDLAEAHHAEANLLWWTPGPKWSSPGRFNHERAIQEFKRALALDPNLGQGHHLLGNVYLHIGLLDQAIDELQKALAISPRADGPLRRIAEARAYQGQYAEAVRTLEQTGPESNQALWYQPMTSLLLRLGQRDSAQTLIQGYLQAHPEDRGGLMTSARAVQFALAGDARRAELDIEAAVKKGVGYIHFHHAAYNIAVAYALLHRPDSAVHWLRTTADGGLPCYPLFASDPFLDNIRGDPGFVAFLREQKAQWKRWRATL